MKVVVLEICAAQAGLSHPFVFSNWLGADSAAGVHTKTAASPEAFEACIPCCDLLVKAVWLKKCDLSSGLQLGHNLLVLISDPTSRCTLRTMSTQPEVALSISKPLLIEPAAPSAAQLPYAPSLTFGQTPAYAPPVQTEAAQSSSQAPFPYFDGLSFPPSAVNVQPGNPPQSSADELQSSDIMQPHSNAAQPGALYGTQQALLAAQHAVATAQYNPPGMLPYPVAPASMDQPDSSFSLPLTMELQQAIAQPIPHATDPLSIPLIPPTVAQDDDQASVETQDAAAQKAKQDKARRSVRKKRPRVPGEPSTRKPPGPITLSVTPVLAAIAEAQPMQCIGNDQHCPGQYRKSIGFLIALLTLCQASTLARHCKQYAIL